MRLYGNDMDADTSVVEAGLSWIVGWKKSGFLGSDRLHAQKTHGLDRKLVPFEMLESRTIARHGHPVVDGDQTIGVVTSGTQTPFLKKSIGFAMVPLAKAALGTELEFDIRGRRARGKVVAEPFYKRQK
jgi:aminomethyltransferase